MPIRPFAVIEMSKLSKIKQSRCGVVAGYPTGLIQDEMGRGKNSAAMRAMVAPGKADILSYKPPTQRKGKTLLSDFTVRTNAPETLFQ